MEINKGDVVRFVDGFFPQFLKFYVIDISDNGLLIGIVGGDYRIGNIKPEQLEAVE